MLSIYLLNCCSFVDRDMVVRYHWGHGIRHTYSHQSQRIQKTNDADLEKDVQEMEVRQEILPQTSWSSPHTKGTVTSHPNEENKGNGNDEAGDDSEELDMESYDEYDSEDDNYNYRDDEDSEEEDEISDDDIE